MSAGEIIVGSIMGCALVTMIVFVGISIMTSVDNSRERAKNRFVNQEKLEKLLQNRTIVRVYQETPPTTNLVLTLDDGNSVYISGMGSPGVTVTTKEGTIAE